MLDYETLATGTQPVILTMGAVRFDPLGDEAANPSMEVLYLRLDIESQVALGREIDDSTIEWWSRQTPQAQEEALGDGTPDNPRYTIAEAMDRLHKFYRGCDAIWSNGSTADVVWSETAYRQVGQGIPWKYWQVMDCRTAFAIGLNPSMPPVTAHHALEDAVNQAIAVQNVYRQLAQCRRPDDSLIAPFTVWRNR